MPALPYAQSYEHDVIALGIGKAPNLSTIIAYHSLRIS